MILTQEEHLNRRRLRASLTQAEREDLDSELLDAATHGDNVQVRWFLSQGAGENVRNGFGNTGLLVCAAYGHTDTTLAFLDSWASPVISNRGQYPLSVAISGNFLNTADVILQYMWPKMLTPRMRDAVIQESRQMRDRGYRKIYQWAAENGLG